MADEEQSRLLRKFEDLVSKSDAARLKSHHARESAVQTRVEVAARLKNVVSVHRLVRDGLRWERGSLPEVAEECYEKALFICETELKCERRHRIFPQLWRGLERVCVSLGKTAEAEMHRDRIERPLPEDIEGSYAAGSSGFFSLLGI